MHVQKRSESTKKNYGLHLAQIALHHGCLPTVLEDDQIEDYLQGLILKGAQAIRILSIRFMGSTAKIKSIARIRKQLPALKPAKPQSTATTYNPLACPCSKKDTMITLLNFDRRGPPSGWKTLTIADGKHTD